MPKQDKLNEPEQDTVTPEDVESQVEVESSEEAESETPQLDLGPPPEDDGKMPTGLWVTDMGIVKVCVYLYKNLRDGKLFFFTTTPLTEARKKELSEGGIHLKEFEIPAEFSVPDRRQIDRYRDRSSSLHEASGQLMISRSGMRRCILRYHLLNLGLPNPETGEPLQMERESGRISKKVEDLLEKLHPNLVEMLVSQFEMETGISV